VCSRPTILRATKLLGTEFWGTFGRARISELQHYCLESILVVILRVTPPNSHMFASLVVRPEVWENYRSADSITRVDLISGSTQSLVTPRSTTMESRKTKHKAQFSKYSGQYPHRVTLSSFPSNCDAPVNAAVESCCSRRMIQSWVTRWLSTYMQSSATTSDLLSAHLRENSNAAWAHSIQLCLVGQPVSTRKQNC